eukprot:CAMPEP_0171313284 /NCGR_PEP_ID=MMETSP0816-20121228/40320_1 /TAXON_ID=420281 /ORGANISM="Proboscia inermis, Strain CCAP1064/1" /LENGTH=158 /DNA_ID=CAMNT_0011800425 /DNA_START=89 /DNA_END=565 /DNA_ORIENTATION=-
MSFRPPDQKDGDLVPVVLALFGFAAFFMSPFGTFFFAITNTIIAGVLLTPVILFFVYQLWSAVYMMEGACPTCGQAVKVFKGESENPNFCVNCGASVRSAMDGKNLEICNVPPDFGRTGNSFLDVLISNLNDEDEGGGDPQAKQKRETTVIDVNIEEE